MTRDMPDMIMKLARDTTTTKSQTVKMPDINMMSGVFFIAAITPQINLNFTALHISFYELRAVFKVAIV